MSESKQGASEFEQTPLSRFLVPVVASILGRHTCANGICQTQQYVGGADVGYIRAIWRENFRFYVFCRWSGTHRKDWNNSLTVTVSSLAVIQPFSAH